MSKRIYIVEDEAIVALEIKRAIIKLGYDFSGMASNYDDALQGIKETTPDLILMDITLKYSKSGIEIAKELQKSHYVFQLSFSHLLQMSRSCMLPLQQNPLATFSNLLEEKNYNQLFYWVYTNQHKRESIKKDLFDLGKGYFYNKDEKLLFYGNEHIPLGKKETKLLHILVEAKGEIVSFSLLEEMIWEDSLSREVHLEPCYIDLI